MSPVILVRGMLNEANRLIDMGYQARKEGRVQQAHQLFSEAVSICRQDPSHSALAQSLIGLGQIERDLKNNQAALQCYEEAVTLLRSQADPMRLAHAVRHLGDILRNSGALEEARPCYEEALAIYRHQPQTTDLDLANTLRGFALLCEATNATQVAAALWTEARSLYHAQNVIAGVEECDAHL